jgi:hypothetical protein
MANDDSLKVSIGDSLLTCRSGEDAAILEPVGGILVDGSTEGYTLEQLDQMAATLRQYDRRVALAALERLIAERKSTTG